MPDYALPVRPSRFISSRGEGVTPGGASQLKLALNFHHHLQVYTLWTVIVHHV